MPGDPNPTFGTDRSLVGRDRELDTFTELLGAAARGQAVAMALVGEAGIGKTRLLQELGKRAEAAGFLVLSGRASELEREVPFDLVIDALDEPFGRSESTLLRRLSDQQLTELGSVLPGLAARNHGRTTTLDVERYCFHRAVRSALAALASQHPILLALDDVHWADPASVELISHLLRRCVPRSLVAIAYRSAAAPSELRRTLGWVTRYGGLRSLELSPLALEEAARLLDRKPGDPRLEAIYRDGGGIPFYLEQLARAGGPRSVPLAQAVDEPLDGVPSQVRGAIAHELEQLTPDARRLAFGAAVVGQRFDLDLAIEVVGLEELSGERALDELAEADLFRPTDVAREFEFRHPIVRRATYYSGSAGCRLGTHRAAAQALARRHAPIGIRAHHLERSASAGDEEATAALIEAARAVETRAPASAARWLKGALRLMLGNSPRERRFELMTALAAALGASGRLREARDILSQALELAPTHGRGHAVTMLARTEQALGHGEEVRMLLIHALAEAEPGSVQAATLTLELADNEMMGGHGDQAAKLGGEARDLARQIGSRALALRAAALLTHVNVHRGAIADAQRDADEVALAFDALGDGELAPCLEALTTFAWVEVSLQRFGGGAAHAERALSVARATGHNYALVRAVQGLAGARMMQGKLAEAARAEEMAVEAAILLDSDQMLANSLGMSCWIATLKGDLTSALERGRAAKDAADRAPRSLFAGMARAIYGEALVEAGEYQRGRDQLLTAGGPELRFVYPTGRPHWLRVLTEAELALGRLDAADAAAKRAEALGRDLGLEMYIAAGRLARALVLLARGATTPAASAASDAAELYLRANWPVEAARARLVLGRALAFCGETASAIREFDAAYTTCVASEARRIGDQAARELRRLGRRTPRRFTGRGRAGNGLAALTPREREVAALVVRGHTNREIGEALFVSTKTVETHLSHIYEKLDLSSRAALAAAVERDGSPLRAD